ncbi:uncharacterized protein [Mobula birostris]|uniref:uncharacterized protein n=1 Tax=Mobula birostris TaxID=1983395 RepID=UPI003B28BD5D
MERAASPFLSGGITITESPTINISGVTTDRELNCTEVEGVENFKRTPPIPCLGPTAQMPQENIGGMSERHRCRCQECWLAPLVPQETTEILRVPFAPHRLLQMRHGTYRTRMHLAWMRQLLRPRRREKPPRSSSSPPSPFPSSPSISFSSPPFPLPIPPSFSHSDPLPSLSPPPSLPFSLSLTLFSLSLPPPHSLSPLSLSHRNSLSHTHTVTKKICHSLSLSHSNIKCLQSHKNRLSLSLSLTLTLSHTHFHTHTHTLTLRHTHNLTLTLRHTHTLSHTHPEAKKTKSFPAFII